MFRLASIIFSFFSLFPAHINISYSNNNVYILCRKRGRQKTILMDVQRNGARPADVKPKKPVWKPHWIYVNTACYVSKKQCNIAKNIEVNTDRWIAWNYHVSLMLRWIVPAIFNSVSHLSISSKLFWNIHIRIYLLWSLWNCKASMTSQDGCSCNFLHDLRRNRTKTFLTILSNSNVHNQRPSRWWLIPNYSQWLGN